MGCANADSVRLLSSWEPDIEKGSVREPLLHWRTSEIALTDYAHKDSVELLSLPEFDNERRLVHEMQ
jgi:hypothetical protein